MSVAIIATATESVPAQSSSQIQSATKPAASESAAGEENSFSSVMDSFASEESSTAEASAEQMGEQSLPPETEAETTLADAQSTPAPADSEAIAQGDLALADTGALTPATLAASAPQSAGTQTSASGATTATSASSASTGSASAPLAGVTLAGTGEQAATGQLPQTQLPQTQLSQAQPSTAGQGVTLPLPADMGLDGDMVLTTNQQPMAQAVANATVNTTMTGELPEARFDLMAMQQQTTAATTSTIDNPLEGNLFMETPALDISTPTAMASTAASMLRVSSANVMPAIMNTTAAQIPGVNDTSLEMVQNPDWADDLGDRLFRMASDENGLKEARIRLDPPSLGPLDLQLRVEDGKVSVQFQSSSAQVREMIMQHIDKLRTQMDENDMNLVNVDVSSNSNGDANASAQTASGQSQGGNGQGHGNPNYQGTGDDGYTTNDSTQTTVNHDFSGQGKLRTYA